MREGENAWKRGEGGDPMLTWWALESPCGCKGLRGADREFHSHCMHWRGIPVSGNAWKLWLAKRSCVDCVESCPQGISRKDSIG